MQDIYKAYGAPTVTVDVDVTVCVVVVVETCVDVTVAVEVVTDVVVLLLVVVTVTVTGAGVTVVVDVDVTQLPSCICPLAKQNCKAPGSAWAGSGLLEAPASIKAATAVTAMSNVKPNLEMRLNIAFLQLICASGLCMSHVRLMAPR
jgi:hypothetical protein